jgi:Zn-dependent protease
MFLFASFPFLSVRGIPVRVHWSAFLGLIAWISIFYFDYEGKPHNDIILYLSLRIGFIAVIAAIVLMHELAHALAARLWGIRTRGIYLHLFGGVALITDPKFVNLKPQQEIVVFSAGPLSNLFFCVLLLLLGNVTNMPILAELFELVAGINLGIGIFNLLPIWPLDGGQIFRAFMAMSRLNPVLSERITLAISLMLGIPIAYLAWKEDEYWALIILLLLMALAVLLLGIYGDELSSLRSRSKGKNRSEPLELPGGVEQLNRHQVH